MTQDRAGGDSRQGPLTFNSDSGTHWRCHSCIKWVPADARMTWGYCASTDACRRTAGHELKTMHTFGCRFWQEREPRVEGLQ